MPHVKPWPQSVALRPWQVRALEKFYALNQRDFFAVATPGAGKTVLALRVAHRDLLEGTVDRIVVVSPTEHLKNQWATAAHKCGLSLDPQWNNGQGVEAADYHGVVVTYQQVQSQPDIHRLNCRRPTLVIFDEIHHAGETQSWGDALRHAFDPAVRRLMLSGTPWRTNNNPIPYLQYDSDGRSHPDFEYGYTDALSDLDVCRAVFFPSFEGKMDWVSHGQRFVNRFEDSLSQKQSAERLRTALATMGGADWLTTVLGAANQKLTTIRQDGHADAAGLVIAMDQYHARRIADLLMRVTGETPTLAISDEPESSARIDRFSHSNERWIVAVRMVSEGVDIPRLRVGVYATNTATEMFFRQAVGRFVRWLPGLEDQTAYLYIPKDPVLVAFAQEVKQERDHELDEIISRVRNERLTGMSADAMESGYVPIDSEAFADDWISPEGGPLTMVEIRHAEAIKLRLGLKDTPENLARAFRDHAGISAPPVMTDAAPTQELRTRKKRLRTVCQRLVGKLASITEVEPSHINARLKTLSGKGISVETEDELTVRLDRLTRWVEEATDARQPVA